MSASPHWETEVLLLTPLPQVTLQSPHSVKGKYGSVAPTHSIDSLSDPVQPPDPATPPTQVLVLVLTPLKQEALQGPNSPQPDQYPQSLITGFEQGLKSKDDPAQRLESLPQEHLLNLV